MTSDEVDEIVGRLTIAGNANDVVNRTHTAILMHDAAALIRRLRDERDEYSRQYQDAIKRLSTITDADIDRAARNKALDEAAERAGRLLGYYDGKAVTEAILVLKSQEPKP